MQTFLPYQDFRTSAECLDDKRLGKQRVETLQIMTALLEGTGFIHHPATKMWAGFEGVLLDYQEQICFIWMRRGFKDTCYIKTVELYNCHRMRRETRRPWWLGQESFHISHQSNLIRKDPEYYAARFPGVPDNLPYIWPV